MTDAESTEQSQQIAARIAGAIFLLVLGLAAFNGFFLFPEIFVSGDAEATARNIIGSELSFRILVAVNLFIALIDVTLGVAIYVLLAPVSRNLAVLALSYRVVECTILGVVTIFHFVVLQLLGGDDYLAAFGADQLNALSLLLIKTYIVVYFVGVAFFCPGSVIYSYLFLKSNYIPKLLAAWGIFASLLMFAWIFAYFLVPNEAKVFFPASLAPLALYELLLGFWLLVIGVNIQPSSNRNKGTDGTIRAN